jgi:prepilin-type N-terminal cleavage/methylation domain-containing protein
MNATDSDMRQDSGVTLIEVLVAMVLASILGSLGMLSLDAYARTQGFQGTADEIVSTLRSTAQRAVSEGRTYCVSFDTTSRSWSVWRTACSTGLGTAVEGGGTARRSTELQNPSFSPATPLPPCPSGGACAYFYPRGTGSPGSIEILRGSDTITVTVEGLTSRVSRS